ncbi:ribose-phosphate pyrophosphokinase [Salmonella phage SE131]|uniref:Ribose-phosphate pyrophosphokinase n=1 Tax=Salmonella phage SE131 TaxID=2081631 RepID=A0A2P1CBA5_9CAUD|nr:ribose-phosphate pyrophosphokinase [Salmonella phage SE131]AVJ48165.1 ribose-phosphate pyrophosphokinase [Salmonella phage SE131]
MINLSVNALDVAIDTGKFSDGALRLKLSGVLPRNVESAIIRVTADTDPQNQFFEVACVVSVLRWINPRIRITLFMPYLPYARQDRRMVANDAFTLKVYANQLNALELDSVLVFDAHSDVGPGLIENCVNIPQNRLLQVNPWHYGLTAGDDIVIVSPDAGALKKIHGIQKVIPNIGLVVLDKERNVETGEIVGMRIVDSTLQSLEDRRCVIFDDICDGGMTFIGAATALKKAGAKSVELVVTHGIFSKGYDHLLQNGVDKIYTTDSVAFCEKPHVDHPQVRIYNCDHLMRTLNYL